MAIPTPEERANGVFICVRDADTRRNIAAAILLDRRAILAETDDVIEAMAWRICFSTCRATDCLRTNKCHAANLDSEIKRASAALATLRWAWGAEE